MSADWSRPLFKPNGRQALLFYFIPGQAPTDGLNLSKSRHHVDDFPQELEVTAQTRADAPEWFASFFARPGLGADLDQVFGAEAATVSAAALGTVVRGTFAEVSSLDYLRNSVGVVSAVVDQGGLGVLDLSAARWWSRAEWCQHFIEDANFDIRKFVRIIVTDDDHQHPGLWMHTRGMVKFGRPDLQIKHIPGPWEANNPLIQAAGDLLYSLATMLARGAAVRDGETMAFKGVKHQCSFVVSPDDADAADCHFGNEALEVVDLVRGKPSRDLCRLLEEITQD
jgi:hypothetical protein